MTIKFSYLLRKSAHLILICIVLIGYFSPDTIFAQKHGQITGRISDAETKAYLPGANVILKGTRFGDATDSKGNYTIPNVPPGSYELVVTYIGYIEQSIDITVGTTGATLKQNVALKPTEVRMEEVLVTGLRQGQTKALNVQKSAENILNVVSEEQMVLLPDLNTAEILQRISSISIVRDQGEGRYVQIRGTDARLTAITVDGSKIAAPDAGERYVGMDVISASQAASIEVSKTVTPDMDADAIGGSVNIKTKSAFDKEKPFLNITAGSGTSSMLREPFWQGGITYGTKFGTDDEFGIAVTGNYDKWHRQTWDLENKYDKKTTTVGSVFVPYALTEIDMRNYDISRTRINFSSNLEYQPSQSNTYFIRGMFNNRDDNELRRNLYVRPSKGTFRTADSVTSAKIYAALKDRLERQGIMAISAGGANKMDNLNLDYTFAYNKGSTVKTGQTDPQFVMSSSVTLKLDQSDPNRPQYTIKSPTTAAGNQYDPINFKLDQYKYNIDKATDQDFMGSVNLKYAFTLADYPSHLKFGGKMHMREKVKNQNRMVYKPVGTVLMTNFVGEEASIYDGTYRLGNVISSAKSRDFFQANKNSPSVLKGTIDYVNSDAASFTADEDILAYYAMNTLNFDKWLFIVGVRHEFTDLTNKSNKVLFGTGGVWQSTTPVEGKHSYNNFLPSAQVRYELTPMSNIRFAYTNTLARPNFFDVVPYFQVDTDNSLVKEGNSELKPTTATNLDLMAEHYFGSGGLVSGGFFYKKINNIIFTQTTKWVGDPYDGFDYTQPVNGGNSELIGFELNLEQQLRFLPWILDGLGLSVNYAYTKSKADVGGRLTRSELPGQAANVANFVVSYEKFGFNGRFSINYNGKFIEEVGEDADHDRIYKAHTQMDFSASQEIVKGSAIVS